MTWRQPTWQPPPSSTCPHAAARCHRTCPPSRKTCAPHGYAHLPGGRAGPVHPRGHPGPSGHRQKLRRRLPERPFWVTAQLWEQLSRLTVRKGPGVCGAACNDCVPVRSRRISVNKGTRTLKTQHALNFQTQGWLSAKRQACPLAVLPAGHPELGNQESANPVSPGASLAGQQLASAQKPVSVVVSMTHRCARISRAGQVAARELPVEATRCWDEVVLSEDL